MSREVRVRKMRGTRDILVTTGILVLLRNVNRDETLVGRHPVPRTNALILEVIGGQAREGQMIGDSGRRTEGDLILNLAQVLLMVEKLCPQLWLGKLYLY